MVKRQVSCRRVVCVFQRSAQPGPWPGLDWTGRWVGGICETCSPGPCGYEDRGWAMLGRALAYSAFPFVQINRPVPAPRLSRPKVELPSCLLPPSRMTSSVSALYE